MSVNEKYIPRNLFTPELYCAQTNGKMSDSIIQNWTPQAIECYELNQNCKNCSISKGCYGFVCQMSKVIEHLLKTIGKPNCSSDNTKY